MPGIQGGNGPLEIDQKHGLPIGSPIAVVLEANPMLETGDGDQGSVRGNHDQIASDAGLNGTPHDTHRRHGFDRCDHGVGDDLAADEVEVRRLGLSGGARVHGEESAFVADLGIDDGDVQQHCSDSRHW